MNRKKLDLRILVRGTKDVTSAVARCLFRDMNSVTLLKIFCAHIVGRAGKDAFLY